MTTILSLVQSFTDKTGIPTPAAVVGVTEKSVRQLRTLLQECVDDLTEYQWPQQTLRITWPSVATADQGSLVSIFGGGFKALVADTLWNETRHLRIYGPVTSAQWQALQTLPNAGPEYQYWVSNGHFFVSPILAAGETLSGMYVTSAGILDVDGVTAKSLITADNDSLLFPDNVVKRCLEYKWRKQKGEAGWEDDYNAYIGLLAKNLSAQTAPTLKLDSTHLSIRPGITIPAGSWNV
jgi:hypothetical protein